MMKRIVGYTIFAVLLAGGIFLAVWGYLFLGKERSRYFTVESEFHLPEESHEKVFALVTDTSGTVTSVEQCGRVTFQKKLHLHIFPECRYDLKGRHIYRFKNDIFNYRHLFPLDKVLPHVGSFMELFLRDVKNLAASSYFQEAYLRYFMAAGKREVFASLKDPRVKGFGAEKITAMKKVFARDFSTGEMGRVMKSLARQGASRYLVKSNCIILKKPYIKDECFDRFLKWYAKEVLSNRTVEGRVKGMVLAAVKEKDSEAMVKYIVTRSVERMLHDKNIRYLIKKMSSDEKVLKYFSPSLHFMKNLASKEGPSILFTGDTPNPVIMLFLRETFISHEKNFWLIFPGTMPVHFTPGGFRIVEDE